jgi:hypothetical protein
MQSSAVPFVATPFARGSCSEERHRETIGQWGTPGGIYFLKKIPPVSNKLFHSSLDKGSASSSPPPHSVVSSGVLRTGNGFRRTDLPVIWPTRLGCNANHE